MSTPTSVDDSGAELGIPAGFRVLFGLTDFVGINGPLYIRQSKKSEPGTPFVQLGFRVESRHCNPMGNCHGGMMATFCDMLLPMSIHRLSPEVGNRFLPTVSLQIDYLGPAALGTWVQGEAQVLRVTRSMVFAQGLVTADDVPAARTSAIFKIGAPFNPPSR